MLSNIVFIRIAISRLARSRTIFRQSLYKFLHLLSSKVIGYKDMTICRTMFLDSCVVVPDQRWSHNLLSASHCLMYALSLKLYNSLLIFEVLYPHSSFRPSHYILRQKGLHFLIGHRWQFQLKHCYSILRIFSTTSFFGIMAPKRLQNSCMSLGRRVKRHTLP